MFRFYGSEGLTRLISKIDRNDCSIQSSRTEIVDKAQKFIAFPFLHPYPS